MKFRHAFLVFVDNFSTTYKLLLYRIIVAAIGVGLCCAVIIPTLNNILSTEQYSHLQSTIQTLWSDIIALDTSKMHDDLEAAKQAFGSFTQLIGDKSALVTVAVVLLAVIYIVYEFLQGLGNYVTGALVNDKMALYANSSFSNTLIKNLGKASIFNAIYVPLSVLYNAVCAVLIWLLVFKCLPFNALLLRVFLCAVLIIILTTLKMTLTTDWLPALIHGKMNNRQAMKYSFSRKGKHTAHVFSNFLAVGLIIFAINVAAICFTFGAGVLLTVPASYVMLISFEFINYCDANGDKYFIDKDTIIGPTKEKPVSREEFFRGED